MSQLSPTPTVHSTTISRFPGNFFPRTAPHFFGHHDSPSNLAKSRFAGYIFFAVSNRGPLFDTGVSCGAPSAAAQGLHQVALHTHNPNVMNGALSKPACTRFSGRYGQRMPLQLSFFVIALNQKIKSTQCGPIFLYWTAFCPTAGHHKGVF